MKAIRFLSAAALAACLALTACSDYVGKESSHPLYAKAMSAKNAKSYREAADCLEEFLLVCPKSPRAHYDVALVYKENLENYPSAIYHLQKYLDLSGETISKDDQADIRRYMQDCERLMFDSYRVRNDVKLAGEAPQQQADMARLSAVKSENAALRDKLQKYVANEKVILAQNEELRRRLENASAASSIRQTSQTPAGSAASTSSSTSTVRSGGSAPSSTTGTPGTTFTDENGVRYYYVAKGEGLQAVALKMYGKASMWKIIQDANNGVKNPQYGQRLVIPPAPQQ